VGRLRAGFAAAEHAAGTDLIAACTQGERSYALSTSPDLVALCSDRELLRGRDVNLVVMSSDHRRLSRPRAPPHHAALAVMDVSAQ
jgi:hypothetical protein